MRVAIVFGRNLYDCDDYSRVIADRCTDWEEIDDETFRLLERAQSRDFNHDRFYIIQHPEDTKEFIFKTVGEYVSYLKKEQERIEKEKLERAERKKKKAAEKLASEKNKEKEVYEELKKKYGNHEE